MIKRYSLFLSLAFLLLCVDSVFAQYKWDFGGSFGPSNYLGDVGSGGDAKKLGKTSYNRFGNVQWNETKFNLGGYARYRVHPKVSIRGSVTNVRIKGDDKFSSSVGRKARNLSFRNDLLETSITGEYYFYQTNDMSKAKRTGIKTGWGGAGKRKDFSAYVFAGVAGVYTNPKAQYNGSWVKLQPLQTEGVKYSKFAIAIPMGVGVLYTVSRKWKFGFELNYRQTFSDYLDDVSAVYVDPKTLADPTAVALSNRRGELTDPSLPKVENYGYQYNDITKTWEAQKRGDAKQDDTYLTATFTVGYVLKGKNSFYKSKYGSVTKGKRKFKKRRGRAKF